MGVQEGHKEPWRKRKHRGHQRQSTAALGEDSQQRAANLNSTAAIASQDQMPNKDNPNAMGGGDTHSQEAVVPQTTDGMTQTDEGLLEMETMASVDAVVAAVCVRLVQTVRVHAHQWVFAKVVTTTPWPSVVLARGQC